MFTTSFLAGDFSGLPKSPPAPALAVHLLLYEGHKGRGHRAAPSPCRPTVHLPSGRSELQTPEL